MATSETSSRGSKAFPALAAGLAVFVLAKWISQGHAAWPAFLLGLVAAAAVWVWQHWGLSDGEPAYVAPVPAAAPRAAEPMRAAGPAPAPVPAPAAAPAAAPLTGVAAVPAPVARPATRAPAAGKAAAKPAGGVAKAAPARRVAAKKADPAAPARPRALKAARGGKPDDLKLIKGIGPKLEALCNRLGFYHFDQIAAWTPAEIAWVDDNLEGFSGRVTRDGWVAQAAALARGGETAHPVRVKKSEAS